ncbi:TetR/AcrR family transcriptional regulator C-terminal domain-containing protein [Streptomyces aidingensis]|uniref:DNA-binding transcriptional regulator, AcrR family n=1 Tax=Streptomyces aidingensis TaxID=910347 RepID=A0A1I1R1E1_9ACTN|nr:TetR/AcrR family transcriptional regulator C-terminal domain-containing protein [Streptomyces aidingensis]SFD28221.1 DNA-binding transcriptional regulator, AcrR family [Streptomyces aidingensis]
MGTRTGTGTGETTGRQQPRLPLSRERVLRAAVDLADRDGLEAVTMRRLAQDLGVEAMSLYHHVANKGAILDGLIEVVLEEIAEAADRAEAPPAGQDWQAALRARILAARQVLLRHRWAPRLLEERAALNPRLIGYFEGLLGILRAGGFSWDLAHHALHALGSRAIGFAQELFTPDDRDAAYDEATEMIAQMAERLPNLTGMLAEVMHNDPDSTLGWCDDQFEFEFGLDLLLDGLERRRAAGGPVRPRRS